MKFEVQKASIGVWDIDTGTFAEVVEFTDDDLPKYDTLSYLKTGLDQDFVRADIPAITWEFAAASWDKFRSMLFPKPAAPCYALPAVFNIGNITFDLWGFGFLDGVFSHLGVVNMPDGIVSSVAVQSPAISAAFESFERLYGSRELALFAWRTRMVAAWETGERNPRDG